MKQAAIRQAIERKVREPERDFVVYFAERDEYQREKVWFVRDLSEPWPIGAIEIFRTDGKETIEE